MHPCRVHFVWNECKRSFRSLLSQVVIVVVVAFACMREDTVVEGNPVVDKDILSLVELVQGSPSLVDNSSSSLVVVVVVVGTCTVKDKLVAVVVENSSVLVVKGSLVVVVVVMVVVLTMEGSSAEVVDIVLVVGYCTCWRLYIF